MYPPQQSCAICIMRFLLTLEEIEPQETDYFYGQNLIISGVKDQLRPPLSLIPMKRYYDDEYLQLDDSDCK